MSHSDTPGDRKSSDIPAAEPRFSEDTMPVTLTERDALRLVEALENPPRPNAAARRAAKRFKKQHHRGA
jgi:uncharacterized protein (DUF1778 family)